MGAGIYAQLAREATFFASQGATESLGEPFFRFYCGAAGLAPGAFGAGNAAVGGAGVGGAGAEGASFGSAAPGAGASPGFPEAGSVAGVGRTSRISGGRTSSSGRAAGSWVRLGALGSSSSCTGAAAFFGTVALRCVSDFVSVVVRLVVALVAPAFSAA